mmetsp:Transcript_46538/g.74002  ORF Transcript_46538/g.74002 Transcript_46538/m.74002 type:complete len:281 (+) Transcript_46538:178-1020(+)
MFENLCTSTAFHSGPHTLGRLSASRSRQNARGLVSRCLATGCLGRCLSHICIFSSSFCLALARCLACSLFQSLLALLLTFSPHLFDLCQFGCQSLFFKLLLDLFLLLFFLLFGSLGSLEALQRLSGFRFLLLQSGLTFLSQLFLSFLGLLSCFLGCFQSLSSLLFLLLQFQQRLIAFHVQLQNLHSLLHLSATCCRLVSLCSGLCFGIFGCLQLLYGNILTMNCLLHRLGCLCHCLFGFLLLFIQHLLGTVSFLYSFSGSFHLQADLGNDLFNVTSLEKL